jgi:hypothetical protein
VQYAAARGDNGGEFGDADATPRRAHDAKRGTTSQEKVHGRGAGSGRDLGPHGEPAFEALHPSWRAKRQATRRHAKTVSKQLRTGTGADVVVVPSAHI